ncbi:N-acetyl-D-Glu racemase DgcA [Amorphus coralli]|uniref:N-acetyl-D-Glu racemase DgcA n=1 Tax=Amorphus coralli TaxID=340680 RepID=UPI00036EF039|nr:N-acetyl-D-Glu racemase DgcA [Amorphus coralli]
MTRSLTVNVDTFPIAGEFRISRESRTEATVVVAEITDGEHRGRGEGTPYARYAESVAGVVADIEAMAEKIAAGLDRQTLLRDMPAGAARNALDCALFDLEAKTSGTRAFEAAGLAGLEPVTTAYTLSLGEPDAMRAAAEAAADRPLLKVKLGGVGDVARIKAVRAGAPNARLIVDANEAWSRDTFFDAITACADAGVELVEQPLPADRDGLLATVRHPVPVCADESVHVASEMEALTARYDAVNIKLDKAGGLTEAILMLEEADRLGLKVMVGCMLASSLAMAPAVLLAQKASVVDLDGPLLLAKDREPALRYEGSLLYPPEPELWG